MQKGRNTLQILPLLACEKYDFFRHSLSQFLNLEKNIDTNLIPSGYKDFLSDLKEKIRSSQLKAAVKVNQELIKLYFDAT